MLKYIWQGDTHARVESDGELVGWLNCNKQSVEPGWKFNFLPEESLRTIGNETLQGMQVWLDKYFGK